MSGESKRSVDVLVVGAGVIGLAVAYELLLRGRSVTVVDRGRPGGGATQAAGGMLAPTSEAATESPLLLDFASDSLRRYGAFVRGLEQRTGIACGYRTEGTLWAALDRDDRAELRHAAATLAKRGLAVQELDGASMLALEPHLCPRVIGGFSIPGDHQLDPRRLSCALERALVLLRGSIHCGVTIDEVVARGGRVRGVCGRHADGRSFEAAAQEVVLAAGAWSLKTIRSPLGHIGLRPVKGQLVRLRGTSLLTRVVRTPRAYLVPRQDGELLVGATLEEVGFDSTPTAGAVRDLLRYGWEVLPAIDELELAEVSVGLRSAVDDQLPLIGASEIDGLFLAFGHFRNGVLLAPGTAYHLADWIEQGVAPPELEPFAPRRIAGTLARST